MSNHPINNINSAFFRQLPMSFPYKPVKHSSGLTINFSTDNENEYDGSVDLSGSINDLHPFSMSFNMENFIKGVSNFVNRYKGSNKKVTSEDLLKEDLLDMAQSLQQEIYKRYELYHYDFMALPISRSMTIVYNYKLSKVTRAYTNVEITGNTLDVIKSYSPINDMDGSLSDTVHISLLISPVIKDVILSINEAPQAREDHCEAYANYIEVSNLNSMDLSKTLKLTIEDPIFLDNIAYAAKEYADYIKDESFDLEKHLLNQGEQRLSLNDDYDFLDL